MCPCINNAEGQVWWLKALILTFGKRKQVDCREFKTNLVSWPTEQIPDQSVFKRSFGKSRGLQQCSLEKVTPRLVDCGKEALTHNGVVWNSCGLTSWM